MIDNPVFAKYLAENIQGNPQMEQMYQMMLANQQQQATQPKQADKRPNVKYLEQIRQLEHKLATAKKAYIQLRENLDAAFDFQEDMALALGACPDCWGQDKRCQNCAGKGKSGFFEPDEALYDQYVRPATEKTKTK